MMIKGIRQGDILLVPVEKLPARAKPLTRKRGEGIIVAEGEATGHHHRIRTPGARMYRAGRAGASFVRVPSRGATLTHEEHAPLKIQPGLHRVVHQREYVERGRTQRVYD